MTLATVIATHNDAALEALTSKGLLRRALRDLAAGKASIVELGDHGAEVIADGQTVLLDERGPSTATCTCSAQTTCRHILLTVLALRNEFGPGEIDESETVTAADDICKLEQRSLEKFAGTDWLKATMLAADNEPAELRQDGPNTTLTFSDLNATVTFIGGQGLREAVYKGAKTRRRLLVTVGALLIRAATGITVEQSTGAGPTMRRPVSEKFLDQAQRSIEDAVAAVLPGHSAIAHDIFFDLAISSRVEALPRVSSELRALANQAQKAVTRDVEFEPDLFLKGAAHTYALLEALKHAPDNVAYTGLLRRDYRQHEKLELWMLGAARWQFASGARGVTAHAYAPSEDAWYTVSDGRAAGTDPAFDPANAYAGPLWGAGSMQGLAGQGLCLPEPVVAPDRSISKTSPLDAVVTNRSLSMKDLLESGCASDDWSVLRNSLAGRFGAGLMRRAVPQPALIVPSGFDGFAFNDLAQSYEWEVRDTTGERLILSIPGDEHETAGRLRQLGKRIQAILVEVHLDAQGLTFRPVTIFRKSKSLDVHNIDFDAWPYHRGLEKAMDKLADVLAISTRPVLVAPDTLHRIVSDAMDACVAILGNSRIVDLEKIQLRCEASGLLSLGRAILAVQQTPTVPAALKASYIAGETEAALWFNR